MSPPINTVINFDCTHSYFDSYIIKLLGLHNPVQEMKTDRNCNTCKFSSRKSRKIFCNLIPNISVFQTKACYDCLYYQEKPVLELKKSIGFRIVNPNNCLECKHSYITDKKSKTKLVCSLMTDALNNEKEIYVSKQTCCAKYFEKRI